MRRVGIVGTKDSPCPLTRMWIEQAENLELQILYCSIEIDVSMRFRNKFSRRS